MTLRSLQSGRTSSSPESSDVGSGVPAIEEGTGSSPPEEIIPNSVSDARFQYFIYKVLRPPRDPEWSKRLGVEITFDQFAARFFQLVHRPRRPVQDLRDPKYFKRPFLLQRLGKSHLLLPDNHRLFHGVDVRIRGPPGPRLSLPYLLP